MISETELIMMEQIRILEDKIKQHEASRERNSRVRNSSSGITPTYRGRKRMQSFERKTLRDALSLASIPLSRLVNAARVNDSGRTRLVSATSALHHLSTPGSLPKSNLYHPRAQSTSPEGRLNQGKRPVDRAETE
jgi:hypothetical protein